MAFFGLVIFLFYNLKRYFILLDINSAEVMFDIKILISKLGTHLQTNSLFNNTHRGKKVINRSLEVDVSFVS